MNINFKTTANIQTKLAALALSCLILAQVPASISNAQEVVCCDQEKVQFREAHEIFNNFELGNITPDIRINTSMPASRSEVCDIMSVVGSPPAPWEATLKCHLTITGPHLPKIHDGDEITVTATYTNEGGVTCKEADFFLYLNGNEKDNQVNVDHQANNVVTLTFTHTVDFDADTKPDPNDGSFRILEIFADQFSSEHGGDATAVKAIYECEIHPANPPGPIVHVTPVDPVCTTCGNNNGNRPCAVAGIIANGSSKVCAFPVNTNNGSIRDYGIATTPGQSGCSSCGGGGGGLGNVPNSLLFERRLIPANQITIGNSSPGMYFVDMDLRLDIYHTTNPQNNVAIFADPTCERSIYLTDTGATGSYEADLPGKSYIDGMTLYDSGGNVEGDIALAVKAEIKDHNGWLLEFAVCPTPIGCHHWGARISKITSPDGFEKSFTYKTFTQTQIDDSPTRQYQIDTITDPSGNTAQITYEALQMAGRWVVSSINVNNGMVTLDYQYNGDGHLDEVKRNGFVIDTYEYGIDLAWNAPYIKWDHKLQETPEAKDTIFLSSDYLNWDGELVNQFADVLLGRADGYDYKYMSVSQHPTIAGQYRVEYRGQLIEWTVGQSWQYFDSWSLTGSGYNGYSGTLEPNYASHYDPNPDNYLTATPKHVTDATGYSVEINYDANRNVHTINHGIEIEKYLYDSNNQVEYYKDRAGYVTLTERNPRGLVIRVSRGHLDPEADGTSIPQPEATQTIYGYYSDGDDNEGLLKWTHTGPYVAGPIVEPPANARTDYIYSVPSPTSPGNQLLEVIKPLPVGQTTRPKVVYAWANGQVFSMTDETQQVTTYNRDDYGRINETLYPDGSSTQRARYGNYIYDKDRNNIVTRTALDLDNRRHEVIRAWGVDSNIITSVWQAAINWRKQSPTNHFFIAGRLKPYRTRVERTISETDYDYRGRTSETRRYAAYRNEPFVTSNNVYQNNMLFSTTESWPGYSKTTYNGYSGDRFTVRKISTRIPTVTFADNTAVMNATRVTGIEPDFMIADAVRDIRGNLIQTIDGRSTITMNDFDALGRQKQTTRGHGTAMALTSSTTYTPRGQVELTTDPAGMQVKTEYDDAGNVEKRTQAFGTQHALLTSYTYDPKGRQKTVTAPSGGVSTSHYDDCCGNTSASEDAYGDGSVRVADAGGRTVYQAQVKDFDFDTGDYKDPPVSETLSESTTRYHENGKVKYTTRWKSARGSIDPANPPIAGVDGVAISEGVTSQYVYFYNLHSSGYFTQSITRLDGGTATINMYNVMKKILDPIASGGIGLNFNGSNETSSHAKATLVISPDEKTMQCSVTDGMGRTVFTGLVHGPASANFNDLINWNCTLYDQGHTLTGFGDTSKVTQVDRDGNTTSSLTDGFGQGVGSHDQDDNLTRSKYDEGGSLRERIDANSNSVNYTYDLLGRKLTTSTPAGTNTTVYNNTTGRVDSRLDAKNNSTSFVYDILGRQETVTDRLGKNTVRTYDSAGRLHTITDAESKTTTYIYDLLGRKLTTTYADAGVVSYDYDPAGSFPTGSKATKMTYDSGKSKTSITSFDGTLDKVEYRSTTGTLTGTDDYTYDNQLRRDGSTSADGIVRALTYNDFGQLETDTTTFGGQSYVVTYGYDDQLRQDSITYPSGRVAAYTFTDRGELDTISWNGSQIQDRLYDPAGRLTNIDRASTDEVRTYDTSNRLLTIQNPNVGDATYTWDANNNKLSETWTGAMASHSFATEKPGASTFADGYDAEDRFRRFIQSGQSNDVYLARTDIGNINDVNINNVSHSRSFSDVHELTDVNGSAQTFDDDNNQLTTHDGVTLGWSDANRLNSTTNGTLSGSYLYDADNKRVNKKLVDNGTTTEDTVYIHAGPNCIAEYQLGVAATSPGNEYIYANSIDSIVLLAHNNNANLFDVFQGQRWSVHALADHLTGSVQERYAYDYFGNRTTLEPNGTTVRVASPYNMPFGFTSREHDEESGLTYVRARYLGDEGEFTSPDPLGFVDGMSTMRGYFGLINSDPSGQVVITNAGISGVKRVGCSERADVNWDYSTGIPGKSKNGKNLGGVIVQKVNVSCKYKKKCCDKFESHSYYFFEAFFVSPGETQISNNSDYGYKDKSLDYDIKDTASTIPPWHDDWAFDNVVYFEYKQTAVAKFFVTNHQQLYPLPISLYQLSHGRPGGFGRPTSSSDGKWRTRRVHGNDPCRTGTGISPSYPTDSTPPFWNSTPASNPDWGTRSYLARYECGCGKNGGIVIGNP